MKIGMALKELFKDLTIDGISVQFHFGDQKELNMWIAFKMKSKKQKYPLIWYVIAPKDPQGNGKFRVDTQLILFQGSKSELFNTERYEKTYLTYLEPLYDEVNRILQQNKFISLLEAYNGIKDVDEPNFGIEKSSLDFVSVTQQKQKAGLIDIVDAKILRLKMDVNPNCLINKN